MYHPQAAEQAVDQVEPSLPAPDLRTESVSIEGRSAPAIKPVPEPQPQPGETALQRGFLYEHRWLGARRLARPLILACLKRLATLAIALIAITMALVTWDYYVT